MEVDKENLENALSKPEQPTEVPKLDDSTKKAEVPKPEIKPETKPATGTGTNAPNPQTPQMPKETEIGFHQGALNTLAAERMELIKIVQNVEKIMAMHIQRLEELGVKVQTKKE